MKIRLGNDVRLKVSLVINTSESGVKSYAHIINARVFFINKTLKEKLEKEYIKKNRFIGRFPIEPFVNEFQPTANNINNSGFPKYRAFVHNEYSGFGVNPNWKKCFPFADENITTYEAAVEYTGDQDRESIIATFPAIAQKYPGEYSMMVIGDIYDAGYSQHKRTVTVDYNGVFELVKNSEEQDYDNPIVIDINQSDSDLTPEDIYVVSGQYKGTDISLKRNDSSVIDIDVSPITGWYVEE